MPGCGASEPCDGATHRPLSFVNDAAPNLTATSASKDTQQCLAALGALINEDSATSVVSLLRDASTAVNLAAIQILTFQHGGETGNYDQCHGALRPQGYHHCLAGSTDVQGTPGVSFSPFAGLCVPKQCGPRELGDPVLATGLAELTAAASVDLALSAVARGQAVGFLANLNEATAAASFLKSGFTCGDHRWSPMRESPAALATVSSLLLLAVVGLGAALARRGQLGKWAHKAISKEWVTGASAVPSNSKSGNGSNGSKRGPQYGAVGTDDDEDGRHGNNSTGRELRGDGNSGGNSGSNSSNGNGNSSDSCEARSGGKQGPWSWSVVCECFDPLRNLRLLIEVKDERRGAFRSLDGVRALSILWVMLGHAIAELNVVGFSNPSDALPPRGMTHTVFPGQLFFSARLAVDTFLWLAAFLLTLGALKKLRQMGLAPAAPPLPSSSSSSVHALTTTPTAAGSDRSGAFSGPTATASADQQEKSRDPRLQPQPSTTTTAAGATPHKRRWTFALLFAVNRILRLLPLYAACVFFWWHVAPRWGNGPFWFVWEGSVDKCNQLWWTNFLFVNNIIPLNGSETSGCFYWAWYLALDMQFAVLLALPAVLLFGAKPLAARRVVLWLTFLTVAAGIFATVATGMSANSFDGLRVTTYSELFYTKPWFRAPSYLIGIYAAMLWAGQGVADLAQDFPWLSFLVAAWNDDHDGHGSHDNSDGNAANAGPYLLPPLSTTSSLLPPSSSSASSSSASSSSSSSSWLKALLLPASLAVLLAVCFGPVGAYQKLPCPYGAMILPNGEECGSGWSLTERAAFNALAPPAWCIAVAVVASLCFRGDAPALNAFLGHPFWVPLARLSYGAYLIHPIVLNFMVLTRATKIRLSGLEFVSFYVAAVGLTFACTLVAVVLVESPLGHLTRIAFEQPSAALSSSSSVSPSSSSSSSLDPAGRANDGLAPAANSAATARAGSLVSIKSLPSTASLELSRPHNMQQQGLDEPESSTRSRDSGL